MFACLSGCEDPLAPEPEPASPQSFVRPPVSSDPYAGAMSPTWLEVYWTDNLTNETGWEIHRSTSGRDGTFALLAQTAANTTSYSDQGLQASTEYCYRIRSFRTAGQKTSFGGFLPTTCAKTLGAPEAPRNIRVTPGLFGAVDVGWDRTVFNTDGLRLERAASAEGPWVTVTTLSPLADFHRDTGRAVEQQVCYRIVAFNAYGETPSIVDCTTPPTSPADLKATAQDEQNIILTWQDRSGAEDGYEVQRAGDDLVWSVVATLPVDVQRYQDGGLTSNTRFWYRVRAVKDGGFSEFAAVTGAITASALPAAPSGTVAIPQGSTAVSVYWLAEGVLAERFRVERSLDGGGSWLPAGEAPAPGFYDAQRQSEQQVCYRVLAVNRLGDSPASGAACTTPPAAPGELRVTSIDDQTYESRWLDNSSVEDGYELWLSGYYEYSEGYYDYYYYSVWLPANTTSYRAPANEFPYSLAAVKDGGYSDWVYPDWGGTATSLRTGALKDARPPSSAQRTPPVLTRRREP
jgi:titin